MTKRTNKINFPSSFALRTSHFYRPTWAEINLQAFCRNARVLAKRISSSKIVAVLKADGYGHGSQALARALAALRGFPLWGFGVSSVEEGLRLRQAGICQRILILGSLFPFESFEAAVRHRLTPTVASLAAAKALSRTALKLKQQVPFHVKVDTGMGRIGMSPPTFLKNADLLKNLKGLLFEGLYTHLAQSDSVTCVNKQLGFFNKIIENTREKGYQIASHAANSEAVLRYPESHYDLVRPGLALYGISPAGARGSVRLDPVMTWKTKIVFIKTVPKGTQISYGGTFTTKRQSTLATLPVGYADGYCRLLSNKGQVLIKGRRCPVAGRVTMDQIVVDVTHVPGIDVGEEVVLLGKQKNDRISVEEMSAWAETIPYEILCGISARVPRIII